MNTLTPQALTPPTLVPQSLTPDQQPRTQLAQPARTTPATITQARPPARPRRARVRTRPPGWVQAWRPPGGAYGPCPEGGSHLHLILDESGSVQGTDPIRYRHPLVLRVLQTLAPACTCGQCTVTLFMFGAGPATASTPPEATTWVHAPRTLAERFASMPWTGSYLGPAMDQIRDTTPSPATITICLTDLELFDPDPSQQVTRFTARPNPQLILLGPGNPPNLPNIPTVRVDDTSPRTEIADQVASHITNTRPQPPQSTPGSPAQESPPRGRTRPTRRTAGLLAAGLAGLALLLLLPWPLHHNNDGSRPPAHAATNPQGTNQQGAAQAEPGTFTIPGLGGNAPRTTPMAAALYIDPSLKTDPDTLARIHDELPAVLDYLHNYRYPGDTITLGDSPPTPLTDLRTLKTAGDTIQPAAPPRTTHSAGGSDRMVAIITDRPTHWQTKFNTRTAKDAQTPTTKHPVRYYTIDITASQPIPTELPNTGPWTIPAAQQPGTVAQATARAWGHAIGAHWLG